MPGMIQKRLNLLPAVIAVGFLLGELNAQQPPDRVEFTRMVAHWANYGDPGYLAFIDDADPEVAQLGFYGAHFWSLAHTPAYKGYPAHFPVRGLNECGGWFQEKNRELHERRVKVIGHFNVEFLVGDPDGPEGPRGFFKFYRDLWDEKELGPRPVADPLDLLERDADGEPISQKGYGIGGMREYWACLRNPHWQTVLKAWVKRGVERGLDGYVANYFYRHDCHCKYCQAAFRRYLKERFTAQQLKKEFGVNDVETHRFKEIVSWHKPDESTPLRREMLRFSQISNKQVFDEVFHRHGRSIKPDLITAQWNHLGAFSQINSDERCMLPADLWGADESYLWYSTGGVACRTDLKNRLLGEGTLQARYIRGAFDDKPFTLGKYENTRIRAAIAELAANGGAPMGFYARFTDPAARREIVRYYQFMKRYDALYRANRSRAEVALLYPRGRVHQGRVDEVDKFRELGTKLLDDHVLFDVVPDDMASRERLARYLHVVRTSTESPIGALRGVSRFEAPFTVRVSVSQPAARDDELTIHFVNYNRAEPPKDAKGRPSAGGGIKDEKPIAARDVRADVRLPPGYRVAGVEAVSPEQPDPVALPFTQANHRVRFAVPEFLVYCVARIKLEKAR
ncbi:MAG: hypothetical protein N2C14_23640 [Planctomycetales bacterium]